MEERREQETMLIAGIKQPDKKISLHTQRHIIKIIFERFGNYFRLLISSSEFCDCIMTNLILNYSLGIDSNSQLIILASILCPH